MSSTIPTLHHHQVMHNCLLILLLTLPTTTRGAGANSHLNSPLKPGKLCNATSHHSCLVSVNGTTYIDSSTLTQGDSISYGGSLVSENGTFKLGFFVRGGNTYLGIWYNYNGTNPEAIIWVANRDNPISQQQHNFSLVLGKDDGIARLLDYPNKRSYWSTGTHPLFGSPQGQTILLQLEENGNLILKVERGSRSVELWQSFENPTDTLLQGQLLYINTSTAPSLTSWEGPDNPAHGNYIIKIESFKDHMGLSIKRINNTVYWDSTGSSSSFPTELKQFLNGTTTTGNSPLRLVLNSSGVIQLWVLLDSRDQNWFLFWSAPKDQCHLYKACGSFGVCDAQNRFMCKCLPGFMPISNALGSGESDDFTGRDCTKRTTDTCGYQFLRLPMINVPLNPDRESNTQTEEGCKDDCQNDCECKAYSFDPHKSICQLFTKDIYNIQQEYYYPENRNLSIRVSPSDIDFGKSACEICGTNVIPYPLSTNFNCGDSNYMTFECDSSNGQVYFSPVPVGNYPYKVSHINEAAMKFVVQLPQHVGASYHKCDTVNNIESKLFNLGNSSPFSVTDCRVTHLIGEIVVVEVEMSWKPSAPPPCITSSDCNYWPNTSCYDQKVCKCANGFHSDFEFLNCTKVDHKEMSLAVEVGIASTCGIVFLLGIIFCILHLRKKKATHRLGITEINKDNDIEDIDIPFVDYESILYATDNFSDANKLGVGGFGPVYKGNLADGNAIAVKRLSAASKQGIEEFRNEVLLIAKLQHRNLVRVLGYCIKGNEKILIYEYMPNKSLDAFLFDHTLSPLLDWIKRFNIIMGIARGLLYLHQDSRLRIIHRDLKPSNILLDEELNPKISDFGLARIVAGNEMTTNSTAKVIGTQGYMSPEYALDGHFSIKSDVYSFGVVVLEIISGNRCTGLLHFDNSLISLLGYAWSLWDKGSPFELVDRSVDSYDSVGVKRCINVGLLCVQEDPSDRPTMSNVLLMLGGENMDLLCPKKPAFITRRKPPTKTSTSSSSNIELTVTTEGR